MAGQLAPSIEWQHSFGGSGDDEGSEIQQTSDSGFVVAAWTNSTDGDIKSNHGGFDYWILKINQKGGIEWAKTFGGSATDGALSAKQTMDTGYVIAGFSFSANGDVSGHHFKVSPGFTDTCDSWIVKINSAGVLQWEKDFGGSSVDDATNIQTTLDLGFIFCGNTESTDGDITRHFGLGDFWIVKLDSAGSLLWQKSLGGTLNDQPFHICQTVDRGYAIVGSSETPNNGDVTGHHDSTDMWIVKLDSSGNLQWEKSLGGSGNEFGKCLQQTKDGGFIIAGSSDSKDGDVLGNHGDYDFWIVKLNPFGVIQWQKSLGGSGFDWAQSLQLTQDSGFIVAGFTTSSDGDVSNNHGGEDFWIVKLDSRGNIEWTKTLGGTGDDEAYSIEETKDGGYIVAGSSFSKDGDVSGNHGAQDVWIVKLRFIPKIVAANAETMPALLCASSTVDTFYVHSLGTGKLIVDSTAFSRASCSLVQPSTLPDTIPPGDSTRFIIAFSPTQAGTSITNLNIYSNDTAHSPWPITISGRKDSAGFAANISTLDLGVLCLNESKDTVITLTNTGTVATKVYGVGYGNVTGLQDTASIATGASVSVPVHFSGSATEGPISGFVTFTDTICNRSVVVNFTGQVEAPKLGVADVALFAVVGMTTTRQVMLYNTSGRTITITTLPVLPSGFSWTIASPPLIINAHDSLALDVTFTPVDTSSIITTLTFVGEPCDVSTTAELTGRGVAAWSALSVSSDSGRPGDAIDILVTQDSSQYVVQSGATALSATLRFNTSLLALIGQTPTNVVSRYDSVIGLTLPAQSQNGVLATLHFRVGLGNDTTSPLMLSQPVALGGAVTMSTQPGLFRLLGVCPAGGNRLFDPNSHAQIALVHPNPVSNAALVDIETNETGRTSLRLVDVSGRVVKEFINGEIGLGQHTVSLNLTGVASGKYFLVFETPTVRKTLDVEIVR